MTTPDRLVTFDNNVLIDLRKDIEPTATYARQLLDFNREGKITVSTTISTKLEKQRAGEEMVGHLYLVDGHKIPLRKRSDGRGRIEAGQEASLFAFFGRPRRFGATKGVGGMRKVSTSRTLQR
jgi:hypothetical protein